MRRVLGTARTPLAALAVLCALAAQAARADLGPLLWGPFAAPPRLQMLRAAEPPVIDGRLDEAVWRAAPGFRGMVAHEPVEQGKPTEETEIRLLYDSNFLYVGVRCFDREPDKIRASSQIPDDFMLQDDVIGIFFDSFGSGRSGYNFATDPLGNRYEALIEGSRTESEWDGIWYVKSRIDEQGWTAEIAIPFKTLLFEPHSGDWGFQFVREVRRKNEKQRLMHGTHSRRNYDLAEVARLAGMRGLEQGVGLAVKPSFSTRYRRELGHRRDGSGSPSLDAFYHFTPALTGALTFNTDFSKTPVDTRRINLTRSGPFFPEQRDLFLEDADIFDLGGLSKKSGVGTRENPIQAAFLVNGMPFFSRSIGIAPDGEPVDLEVGAKLTGRIGRASVGLLSVRTDSHHTPCDCPGAELHWKLERDQLSVARAAYNVLDESRVGVIATHGDPAFNRDARTVGADFNYRTSHLFGNRVLLGSAWVLGTSSERVDRHDAAHAAPLGEASQGTAFGGRPRFQRTELSVTSRDVHPLSGRVLVSYGECFAGKRLETDVRLIWRPSSRYQPELDYIQNDVRWPTEPGDFTSRVVRGRVFVAFTTDLSWDTTAQCDNASDSIGLNSRLRWIADPGNEVFPVFNHGWTPRIRTMHCDPGCIDPSDLRSSASELAGEVEWTYRFWKGRMRRSWHNPSADPRANRAARACAPTATPGTCWACSRSCTCRTTSTDRSSRS